MKKKVSSFIVDTIFIATALGITDMLMEKLFNSESFLLELIVYAACYLLLNGLQWFAVYFWNHTVLRKRNVELHEDKDS